MSVMALLLFFVYLRVSSRLSKIDSGFRTSGTKQYLPGFLINWNDVERRGRRSKRQNFHFNVVTF